MSPRDSAGSGRLKMGRDMPTTEIRQATFFWIEAGSMQDLSGPHDGLELPDEVVEFFDDGSPESEVVRARLPDGGTHECALAYAGVDYEAFTDQWRLELPDSGAGGPAYAGRIVGFERTTSAGGYLYGIVVAEPGSPESEEWPRRAEREGQVEEFGSITRRRYGFW